MTARRPLGRGKWAGMVVDRALTETAPMFRTVDLTELWRSGVLFEANRRFFWPLGLALTWEVDSDLPEDERVATNLHIRQWEYEDGHVETIEDSRDEVTLQRIAMFREWLDDRRSRMPDAERAVCPGDR